MKDLPAILSTLRESYPILNALVSEIPVEAHKIRRIPDKWCIHEQVCHLADVQRMLLDRLHKFQTEDPFVIQPYLPGDTVSDAHLIEMDLSAALEAFREIRNEQISFLESIHDGGYWSKIARHPQYKQYTPLILARHILMHDHFHMYRIEELWLTEEEYL